jgi:hypothetical protein
VAVYATGFSAYTTVTSAFEHCLEMQQWHTNLSKAAKAFLRNYQPF